MWRDTLRSIGQDLETLGKSSESLNRLIGQTISRVLDLEASQQTQVAIFLNKTMSSLESLLEKHGLSAGAAGLGVIEAHRKVRTRERAVDAMDMVDEVDLRRCTR